MESPVLIRNINDVEPTPVDSPQVQGVRMSVMVGRADGASNFAVRQFTVEPGGHTPHHSHDYEHEVYILAGAGTVLLDSQRRPVKPGDVVFVPADHEHQFQADDVEGLRFLCITPARSACGAEVPGT